MTHVAAEILETFEVGVGSIGSDEITPEMIEAGAAAFANYDSRFEGPNEVVAEIFRAMTAASSVGQTGADAVDFWKGSFGEEYSRRNAMTPERVERQARLWSDILKPILAERPPGFVHPPQSVMEVGANVGINLAALRSHLTGSRFFAVEPNDLARGTMIDFGLVDELDAYSGLDDAIGTVDLIFTCGCLIHIPPDELLGFCQRIHSHAGRWIVAVEYFSKEPREVPYRGHAGKLWTRDFGSFYLRNFPNLHPVACGFAWSKLTGLDDVTYWVFEKETTR